MHKHESNCKYDPSHCYVILHDEGYFQVIFFYSLSATVFMKGEKFHLGTRQIHLLLIHHHHHHLQFIVRKFVVYEEVKKKYLIFESE